MTRNSEKAVELLSNLVGLLGFELFPVVHAYLISMDPKIFTYFSLVLMYIMIFISKYDKD